jgi:AsmA protein
VAGLAVFAALFDPNDYRGQVAEFVREQTGRELLLAGPLELSIFPWLAVEAENVTLGNAQGFGEEPMLRVGRVSVGLQLLPLLSGEMRVGGVELDGLELLLARSAEGRTNWDDLLELAERRSEAPAQPVAAEDSGKGGEDAQEGAADAAANEVPSGSFRLTDASLDGLTAENVRVVWDDRSAAVRYELSGGRLHVGEVRYGAPLDVEAEFGFGLDDPKLAGRFKLAGNLAFDLDRSQYAASRLTLALRAEGADLPGGTAKISLAVDQLRADLDKGTASASAFTVLGYEAQVSGSFSVRELRTAPAISGVLELKNCNPRYVLAALGAQPPETADPAALSALGATLRFDMLPDRLNLPFLALDLDGQHLEGSASARLDQPDYLVVLEGEQFDLDRYLPPSSPEQDATDTADAGQNWTPVNAAAAPPVAEAGGNATGSASEPEWLTTARKMELRTTLGINRLHVGKMDLAGLRLALHAKRGVVAVEPLDVRLTRGEDEYRLVTGKVFGDLHTFGVRADSFGLAAPGGGVSGSLSATNLREAPEASGKLALEHLDLRRLSQALGDLIPLKFPETSDPKALTDLHGNVEFNYTPGNVDVPGFDLLLDGSSLKGRLRMRTDPAVYDVVLKADRLDLDRYLPPKAEAGKDAEPAPGAQVQDASGSGEANATARNGKEESGQFDLLAQFRTMRADADVEVGVLTWQGLSFADIKGVLHTRDGVTELDPCRVSLDKGRMELAWKLDAQGEGANSLTATVRGLALGSLLQRFAGINDARGTLTMRTIEPLTWTGLDAERFKRSFSGSLGFAVRDGEYPGLDLFEMLTVVDKLTKAVLEGGRGDSTKFGEVTGTVVARKGRVSCDDLCVKAPGLRAGGAGFVNLPDGGIDYLVRAMAVPDASGQGGAPCDEYYGIPVPVRITGTLDEPHYRVSAEEYAASVARGAVGLLGGVVKGGAEAVGAVLGTGADAAQSAAQSVVEGGQDAIQGGTEAVGGAVEDSAKGGVKAVEDFIDTLKDAF